MNQLVDEIAVIAAEIQKQGVSAQEAFRLAEREHAQRQAVRRVMPPVDSVYRLRETITGK